MSSFKIITDRWLTLVTYRFKKNGDFGDAEGKYDDMKKNNDLDSNTPVNKFVLSVKNYIFKRTESDMRHVTIYDLFWFRQGRSTRIIPIYKKMDNTIFRCDLSNLSTKM